MSKALAIHGGPKTVSDGLRKRWPEITEEDKGSVMEVLDRGILWGPIRYGYFSTQIEPLTTIPHVYSDYKEMARDPQINAVTICTPNSLHALIALEMLNHHKHVLLEKPMTSTLTEAKQVVQADKKAGVVLLIGYMWRFHQDVQCVKKIIEEGVTKRGLSLSLDPRWGE